MKNGYHGEAYCGKSLPRRYGAWRIPLTIFDPVARCLQTSALLNTQDSGCAAEEPLQCSHAAQHAFKGARFNLLYNAARRAKQVRGCSGGDHEPPGQPPPPVIKPSSVRTARIA